MIHLISDKDQNRQSSEITPTQETYVSFFIESETWNARIRNRNTRNSPNDRKMMNLKIFIYLFIYLLFRNILKMH